jgi:hypothetical protein
LRLADFNNDGILDIAASNNFSSYGELKILLGNGDGTFGLPSIYTLGTGAQGLSVADFNQDGNLDIAVGSNAGTGVSVELGDGTGHFSPASGSPVASGTNPAELVAGDFNGDGQPDLAFVDYTASTMETCPGNGDGTFAACMSIAANSGHKFITAADFNQDGNLDLATCDYRTGAVGVYLGNGDGSFQMRMSYSTGALCRDIQAGDFSGDGVPDLEVSNSTLTYWSLTNQLNQTASASVSSVSVPGSGSHNVAAAYTGDSQNAASTSGTTSLTASKSATTIALAAAPVSTSQLGQQVILSSTLNPYLIGSETTEGEAITFYNNGVFLGTGTLSSGYASLSINTLPVGTNSLTAVYTSDANFLESTSSAISYTIAAAYVGSKSANANFLGGKSPLIRYTMAAASAYTAPTTNLGSTSPTQTAIVNIATAGTLGTVSVLTQGAAGLDYAYVTGGTCATGTAYSVSQSCTVKYTFTPTAPGQRFGAVVLSSSTPTVLGTSYLVGSGTGPLGTFPPGIISTIAGNGTAGSSGDGGQAASAQVNQPRDVALDGAGNLYIADTSNNCVRKINTLGIIATYAGTCGVSGYSGDGGAATSSSLFNPGGIALDGAGNLYIADLNNNVVRKVNAVTGFISTVAGNLTSSYNGDNIAATSAGLNSPQFVMTDSAGNFYISDVGNARVREVTIATGMITTIFGNGTSGYNGDGFAATSAETNSPGRLAFDSSGNLYIPEKANNRVRMISAATGLISTVAGTGTQSFGGDGGAATSAKLNQPLSATVDAAGNLYIADYGNSRIREVIAATQFINTIAGNYTAGGYSGDGGSATNAKLYTPIGTAITPGANIYIADYRNNRIRLVTQSTPAAMNLPPTAYGASSAASYQTVQNTGNGTLTIASISSSSANFSLGGASSTCAASSQLLASAASCILGVKFTPTSVASLNGTITLTDNTLNVSSSTQTIAVSGTGLAAAPTITFTVSNQTYGVSPFAVSATSNSAGAITYAVVSGPATISGATVTITGAGSVVLGASQVANGNYTAATQNASFIVNQATPTILLGTSSTPAAYGASIILTATLPSSASGTVTFLDSGVSIGSGAITGTTATLTISSLATGTHSLTGSWSGNANYTAGTSSVLSQVITRATATVVEVSSINPSKYGDLLTLSITVSGAGVTPTGTVVLTDSSTALGSVSLNGSGLASFPTSLLAAGAHSLTATYQGDVNYY